MSAVRRVLAAALVLATGVLTGCVYDPYTGTYAPCCGYYGYPNYGSPYYRYPPPYNYAPNYAPQTAPPYTAPPAGQPGAYPNNPQTEPPPQPGAAAYPSARPSNLAQRFAAANVTHDGRLTRDQAEAGMPMVARNFDSIDLDHEGYVTLSEIQGFLTQRRAERVGSGQQQATQ
jgi:hypothetical protein